ncbi:S16 family serine protease [Algibacillus agarilyticus]|uniref:S16 family serine protease n=1 Tax=Algibacillus agarilyticus TaxID=2234133 RepID=UPI000DD0B6C2|nr:S16 family serine protease [Algibacillus agarilyticus]
MPDNLNGLTEKLNNQQFIKSLLEDAPSLAALDTNKSNQFLFPKLAQFIQSTLNSADNCFMLASINKPTDIFVVNELNAGSVSELFGVFAHSESASDEVQFIPSLYFNHDSPLYIPAELLMQDQYLAQILIESLIAKQFNSRCLVDRNLSSTSLKIVHQTIPFNLRIVIYGLSSDLADLRYHFPRLKNINKAITYEADLAFKPDCSNIQHFKFFISQVYNQDITSEQFISICWALSRHIEDQNWLSLDLHYLLSLKHLLPKDYVKSDVEVAVSQLTGFYSHACEFNYEQIISGSIKVDTQGEVIGQVNGLTVVETDNAEFGEPSRITANVFLGDGDIGDIERKSDLGGNIHAKAMMILSSFVSRTFAQNSPMPVSSNIVFEQSYHEVDGDSASIAELYALLSALAKVPVQQNVAITGAMDQLGNVLVVGGLDLKIESFYAIAKQQSPDIVHKVIIPAGNVSHLNLSIQVTEAIEAGTFEIHPIEHVTQASPILLNLPAESDDENNLYHKVRASLDQFDHESEPELTFFEKFKHLFRI